MEIISSNRRNGKKQELLKKIEEMLDKHEIVLAFNQKQLQERDKQIREKVCNSIKASCEETYTISPSINKPKRKVFVIPEETLKKIEKGE